MKCQEVTDLMQRYLDKDLDEQENIALMDHLSECSTCPAIFAKMKQLSNDLTLLPKVSPPFSLVDRIMPQLEEIDQMSSAGDQHAADSKPGPMLTWAKRMNFKVISGVAAAAIVLIILFSNGFPMSFQSANDMANDNFAVQESAKAPASDQNMNNSTSMNMDTGDVSSNTSMRIMDDSTDGGGSSGSAGNEANMENKMVPKDDGQPEVMMTAESMDAAEERYPSPNGEYTAYVQQDGSQVQVFIINNQNEELYSSPLKEGGRVENLQWTEDSQYFEYDMVANETVSHFKVTVEP